MTPVWITGTPSRPGLYERLTSHFGLRVDRWDGRMWVLAHRPQHRGMRPGYGVACANQRWPWRQV